MCVSYSAPEDTSHSAEPTQTEIPSLASAKAACTTSFVRMLRVPKTSLLPSLSNKPHVQPLGIPFTDRKYQHWFNKAFADAGFPNVPSGRLSQSANAIISAPSSWVEDMPGSHDYRTPCKEETYVVEP